MKVIKCGFCENEVPQKEGFRKRLYCDDLCKNKAWRKKMKAIREQFKAMENETIPNNQKNEKAATVDNDNKRVELGNSESPKSFTQDGSEGQDDKFDLAIRKLDTAVQKKNYIKTFAPAELSPLAQKVWIFDKQKKHNLI